MDHAQFVAAAFIVTGAGVAWLILSSWLSMRSSEALADDLRNER